MRKLLTLWIALAAIVGISASSFGGSMMLTGVGPPPAAGGATTTWNPLDKSANFTLWNGKLTVPDAVGGGVFNSLRAIASHSTGKYYFELLATFAGNTL